MSAFGLVDQALARATACCPYMDSYDTCCR